MIKICEEKNCKRLTDKRCTVYTEEGQAWRVKRNSCPMLPPEETAATRYKRVRLGQQKTKRKRGME